MILCFLATWATIGFVFWVWIVFSTPDKDLEQLDFLDHLIALVVCIICAPAVIILDIARYLITGR